MKQVQNDTNEIEDEIMNTDSNNDMVAAPEQLDKTISFKVSESAAPERGWTQKQIKEVWIIAVILTVLFIIGTFTLDILGIKIPFLNP